VKSQHVRSQKTRHSKTELACMKHAEHYWRLACGVVGKHRQDARAPFQRDHEPKRIFMLMPH
jgi:hypothetical protein